MGRASVSYTNKDYESLRRELLDRVPQLTDRWTDFNASDLGVVLLELFCGVGDMLAYYLDAQAAEAFLPTARQRQSVIDLCKLINYRLDTPVASTTMLQFTLPMALDQDVSIPAETVCRALLDEGEVHFETTEAAIIPRGALSAQAGARQGVRKSETFSGAGAPWQEIRLPGQAIAQGSLRVEVNGEPWSETEHFQDSAEGSRHFLAQTDHLDATTIGFGDGRHGAIPPHGAPIAVAWLETLGAAGNLGRRLAFQSLDSIAIGSHRIPIQVTNVMASTGGVDRESLDHARRQAPAELRALWKAVTREDYQALAQGFPGVAKAVVLDGNDCANIRYYNVHLAIAPHGGGLPTPLLKQQLAHHLEQRKVITVEVRLFDPIYRPIPIDAQIHAWPGEDLDRVRMGAEQALAAFFAFEGLEFGQTIHHSDLIALLDGTPGVSHVRLFTPQADVVHTRGEIPVLGPIHLDVRRAQ